VPRGTKIVVPARVVGLVADPEAQGSSSHLPRHARRAYACSRTGSVLSWLTNGDSANAGAPANCIAG
jgi:hypothetical protein